LKNPALDFFQQWQTVVLKSDKEIIKKHKKAFKNTNEKTQKDATEKKATRTLERSLKNLLKIFASY